MTGVLHCLDENAHTLAREYATAVEALPPD